MLTAIKMSWSNYTRLHQNRTSKSPTLITTDLILRYPCQHKYRTMTSTQVVLTSKKLKDPFLTRAVKNKKIKGSNLLVINLAQERGAKLIKTAASSWTSRIYVSMFYKSKKKIKRDCLQTNRCNWWNKKQNGSVKRAKSIQADRLAQRIWNKIAKN